MGLKLEGRKITSVTFASDDVVRCGASVNAARRRASQVMGWAGLTLPAEPRKPTVFVIDRPNAHHPDAPMIIEY